MLTNKCKARLLKKYFRIGSYLQNIVEREAKVMINHFLLSVNKIVFVLNSLQLFNKYVQLHI